LEEEWNWRIAFWRSLGGGPGVTFLILMAIYAVLYFTGSAPGLASLVAVVAFILALVTLIRLLRRTLQPQPRRPPLGPLNQAHQRRLG
jgi:membrane protein implicated in regulation of membrane protease activity